MLFFVQIRGSHLQFLCSYKKLYYHIPDLESGYILTETMYKDFNLLCSAGFSSLVDISSWTFICPHSFIKGIFCGTPKHDKLEHICHSCDWWEGIHHTRICMGWGKLKSHLCNNLYIIEDETFPCGHRSEDLFHFFFECHCYVTQHTQYSLRTLLYGDLTLNHKQNWDIVEAVQHFITLSKCFDWSIYTGSYINLSHPTAVPFPGHTASNQSPWQARFV